MESFTSLSEQERVLAILRDKKVKPKVSAAPLKAVNYALVVPVFAPEENREEATVKAAAKASPAAKATASKVSTLARTPPAAPAPARAPTAQLGGAV